MIIVLFQATIKNIDRWLINRNSFLTVLEAGNSKIKVLVDLVSAENLLPVS